MQIDPKYVACGTFFGICAAVKYWNSLFHVPLGFSYSEVAFFGSLFAASIFLAGLDLKKFGSFVLGFLVGSLLTVLGRVLFNQLIDPKVFYAVDWDPIVASCSIAACIYSFYILPREQIQRITERRSFNRLLLTAVAMLATAIVVWTIVIVSGQSLESYGGDVLAHLISPLIDFSLVALASCLARAAIAPLWKFLKGQSQEVS